MYIVKLCGKRFECRGLHRLNSSCWFKVTVLRHLFVKLSCVQISGDNMSDQTSSVLIFFVNGKKVDSTYILFNNDINVFFVIATIDCFTFISLCYVFILNNFPKFNAYFRVVQITVLLWRRKAIYKLTIGLVT